MSNDQLLSDAAIAGLAPATLPNHRASRYLGDQSNRAHGVDLLLEKWHDAVYMLPNTSARIVVDSRFAGVVCESCQEFAALDRVVYNLLNNAVRNTADATVQLAILPVEPELPRNLRFVVANRVTDTQRARLFERFGESLGELFRGGFTTGGGGLGMRICADFVCNAYGVASIEQALAAGYFGAQLHDSLFVNWFHWPVAGANSTQR
ncbi:MAG TPA: ATP-binding protein [Roseiflexaceae bacterium]|nr:ATP-binding protein [Roseiflexaceae bacterium]